MARKISLIVKLVTLVIALAVIPTCVISYFATNHVNDLGDYALESNSALGETAANDSAAALNTLGERVIEQKAKDVAEQVEIYLRYNPNMTVNDIMIDPQLHDISVETVGKTGYTAIVDATNFVILTHKYNTSVGMDLKPLEDRLPSFWAVIEPSAGGNASWGYYDWLEPDNVTVRQKYAYIAPINATTADGVSGLTLWATTYIDEFSSPADEIKNEISNATLATNDYINRQKSQLNSGLIFVIIVMIIIVIISSIGFARTITKPVYSLKESTNRINEGNLDATVEVKSHDEIGDLARSFDSMRLSLKSSYENLEQKVRDRTEQIRESERRLADIISFLPDPTFVIDSNGKVIAWNRAIEELTGIKAKNILGKGNHEYALPFYGERRPIVIDLAMMPNEMPGDKMELRYKNVQKRGDALIAETFAPSLKTEGRYVFAAASALRNSKGQIVGAIEIVRDITESKKLELALQKAKEVAETASQTKSEFLANMSHEIRTPMNGITGMIDLTLDSDLTHEQREYLELAKDSARSLLALINDILDFSKIEAKKLDMENVDFDLYEAMDQTMRVLAFEADKKGVELVYEIDSKIDYSLKGDPLRLKQVIANLVKNAIKFTEKGHVYVKASEEDSAKGIKKLHFSVADTGIGIPKDKLQVIFDKFTQADGSTTRKYGGTGLGLAITKSLVDIMGGSIWVESEEGKGSAFHVLIPFQEGGKIESFPVHPEDLKGLKTLVIDDNPVNRLILRRNLETWGMNVTEAIGGQDSIEKIEKTMGTEKEFQILILDCMMPGINGFQVVERLKENGLTDIIIIMLSSLDQRGNKEHSKQIGISEYLIKPVSQSALLNSIMNVLSKKERKTSIITKVKSTEYDAEAHIPPETRVLLAEDNLVNRKLAARLLEKIGLKPVTAENGLEVLKALEKEKFDMILMDVQMPEMDGMEATKRIREIEKEKGGHIPIIALTAHAMKGDRERFLEVGMDDYLSKPLNPEELFRTIEKHVKDGSKAQLLDLNDFMDRIGDEEMLAELLEVYLEDTPRIMGEIESAIAKKDAAALRFSAHSLKGMSANLSLMRARETAYELEKMGTSGDLAKAKSVLGRLKEDINKTRDYIDKYLKAKKKGA